MKQFIDRLAQGDTPNASELKNLIKDDSPEICEYLSCTAQKIRHEIYGNDVFIRGLIEISNYCKNNCFYCGIRRDNKTVQRYRLSPEQIIGCAASGYRLGFRTFVLQGGEDSHFTDDILCGIIKEIKLRFPDCAVTLSLGERDSSSYLKLFNAGADRYLLRHETANPEHYSLLHPHEMSFENRIKCLESLKEIGFQVGCGFMVGSPYQTADDIVRDLLFIKNFKPHMVGIGPFISHHATPFKNMENGSVSMTLKLLSIIRIMNPTVLLPATTALGTLSNDGRERGILAGANVIMPNLSPYDAREKYTLYDNKLFSGEEAAESIKKLSCSMEKIGYRVVTSRGDCAGYKK